MQINEYITTSQISSPSQNKCLTALAFKFDLTSYGLPVQPNHSISLGNNLASLEKSEHSSTAMNNNINDVIPTTTTTTTTKKFCCMRREFWSCFALSSIVIGLPIAIMIMLINLPRLSSQRDTRQQHYILLAFGLPFSCVIIVALSYAVYSLIRRIRKGSDNSSLNHDQHKNDIKPCGDSLIILEEEPKLYSLVTQVMSNQRNSSSELFHPIYDYQQCKNHHNRNFCFQETSSQFIN